MNPPSNASLALVNIGGGEIILILGLLFILALFAVGFLGLIYLIVRLAVTRPPQAPSTLPSDVATQNHGVFAATVISQSLSRHSVTVAPCLSTAGLALGNGSFGLLLVDYDLDHGKGDAIVDKLHASGKAVPLIGVSSHAEGNTALLRAGAVAICSKMEFDQIQTVIDAVAAHTKTGGSGLV